VFLLELCCIILFNHLIPDIKESNLLRGPEAELCFLFLPSSEKVSRWHYAEFINSMEGKEPYPVLQSYFEEVLIALQDFIVDKLII
jgi:2-phosphoglycerate kinase